MLWIIGGSGLMDGLQALGRNTVIDSVAYELTQLPRKHPGPPMRDGYAESFHGKLGMNA
jgi:hypothetical protein